MTRAMFLAVSAMTRVRGEIRTFTAHLRFGNPATCERPVALRPRLATGLPFVGRSRPVRR
jgi:hypothetical protein